MPNPKETKEPTNPIVLTYRGVEIRKYPSLRIRVDQLTMRDIIDARIDTGMSDRQILGYSSCPCDSCKNISVQAYNNADKKVEIKRGLLSKRIPKS